MNTEETTQPSEEKSSHPAREESVAGQQPARFVFSNDSLKKQMRPSEFFAEKIITGVAFLSIAIIILIFLFVFRETIPIFSGKAEQKTESSASKQESYGSTEESQNENQQEVYSGSEPAIGETKQEVYGASGDTAKDSIVAGESGIPVYRNNESVAANKVTVKGLAGKVWMPVSDRPRY